MIIDKKYNGFADVLILHKYVIRDDIVCNEDLEIILDKPLLIYGSLHVKGNLTSNVPIYAAGILVEGDVSAKSITSEIRYWGDPNYNKLANIEVGGDVSAEHIHCDKLIVQGNVCVETRLYVCDVKAKSISVGGMIEAINIVETDGDVAAHDLRVRGINTRGSITVKTNIRCYTEISAGSYIDCGGEIFTGAGCSTYEPYIDPTIYNIKCSELRNGKIVRGNLVLV